MKLKEMFYLHVDFKHPNNDPKRNMEGVIELHIQTPAHVAATITLEILKHLAAHDPVIVDMAVGKFMEYRIKEMEKER